MPFLVAVVRPCSFIVLTSRILLDGGSAQLPVAALQVIPKLLRRKRPLVDPKGKDMLGRATPNPLEVNPGLRTAGVQASVLSVIPDLKNVLHSLPMSFKLAGLQAWTPT